MSKPEGEKAPPPVSPKPTRATPSSAGAGAAAASASTGATAKPTGSSLSAEARSNTLRTLGTLRRRKTVTAKGATEPKAGASADPTLRPTTSDSEIGADGFTEDGFTMRKPYPPRARAETTDAAQTEDGASTDLTLRYATGDGTIGADGLVTRIASAIDSLFDAAPTSIRETLAGSKPIIMIGNNATDLQLRLAELADQKLGMAGAELPNVVFLNKSVGGKHTEYKVSSVKASRGKTSLSPESVVFRLLTEAYLKGVFIKKIVDTDGPPAFLGDLVRVNLLEDRTKDKTLEAATEKDGKKRILAQLADGKRRILAQLAAAHIERFNQTASEEDKFGEEDIARLTNGEEGFDVELITCALVEAGFAVIGETTFRRAKMTKDEFVDLVYRDEDVMREVFRVFCGGKLERTTSFGIGDFSEFDTAIRLHKGDIMTSLGAQELDDTPKPRPLFSPESDDVPDYETPEQQRSGQTNPDYEVITEEEAAEFAQRSVARAAASAPPPPLETLLPTAQAPDSDSDFDLSSDDDEEEHGTPAQRLLAKNLAARMAAAATPPAAVGNPAANHLKAEEIGKTTGK